MAKFLQTDSLADFQKLTDVLYTAPDDKLFSLFDLVSILARYSMRTIKGIRKGDMVLTKDSLLKALSWLMTVANRLKIDLDQALWKRFPGVCSYCGDAPCVCQERHVKKRVKIREEHGKKPRTLEATQSKMAEIYPRASRTLEHAGIHLAEEMGEVSEAIRRHYSAPEEKHFASIKSELADYLSCLYNIANSADINVAEELAHRYHNNCYDCHTVPCSCDPTKVAMSGTETTQ